MKSDPPPSTDQSSALLIVAASVLLIGLLAVCGWYAIKASQPNGGAPAASSNNSSNTQKTFNIGDVAVAAPEDRFVTAMVTDSRGRLWVASEGGGVREYDPTTTADKRWTSFGPNEGLADQNVYALAVDRKGRVWAGHLNHGVSVFDGTKWQNYDVIAGAGRSDSLTGPLGERVFAIKTCPVDGDVWIATNAGLTRYSLTNDRWSYFTRADGLPSDATDSIAFDSLGNIFVGTQSNGIAMADADSKYALWRTVNGPTILTETASGSGLPTSQINDVMVTRDNVVYAATSSGLAWSTDRGVSWKFTHGPDWIERWNGSAAGPPPNWMPPAEMAIDDDFITSLAQDNQGSVYLGYRTHGIGKYTHDANGNLTRDAAGDSAYEKSMVRALPPDMSHYAVAGSYGQAVLPIGTEGSLPAEIVTLEPPAMPSSAKISNLDELVAQLPRSPEAQLSDAVQVFPLDDDWRTQGNWVGRYGRDWAYIAAIDTDGYYWGAGTQVGPIMTHDGPHVSAADSPRYWIATLYSDDVRGLELPPVYLDSRLKKKLTKPGKDRRIANVNDNGETHPRTWEGPDLYNFLSIPPGTFVMSIYEMNDDGHKGNNALRDLSIEIRAGHGDLRTIEAGPVLAQSRATDFYNGVYKKFMVVGPCDLSLLLRKNESQNVMMSAVMLDQPTEMPAAYFPDPIARPAPEASPAVRLDAALHELAASNPQWWALNHHRIAVLLARWCQSTSTPGDFAWQNAGALYFSGLFEQLEKAQANLGLISARATEKSLTWQQKWPNNSGQEARDLKAYLDTRKSMQ